MSDSPFSFLGPVPDSLSLVFEQALALPSL